MEDQEFLQTMYSKYYWHNLVIDKKYISERKRKILKRKERRTAYENNSKLKNKLRDKRNILNKSRIINSSNRHINEKEVYAYRNFTVEHILERSLFRKTYQEKEAKVKCLRVSQTNFDKDHYHPLSNKSIIVFPIHSGSALKMYNESNVINNNDKKGTIFNLHYSHDFDNVKIGMEFTSKRDSTRSEFKIQEIMNNLKVTRKMYFPKKEIVKSFFLEETHKMYFFGKPAINSKLKIVVGDFKKFILKKNSYSWEYDMQEWNSQTILRKNTRKYIERDAKAQLNDFYFETGDDLNAYDHFESDSGSNFQEYQESLINWDYDPYDYDPNHYIDAFDDNEIDLFDYYDEEDFF